MEESVPIDPRLLEILVCPLTRGPLTYDRERGELISVPAGTGHWFDMGPDPEFTAIRWFNNQTGWVPQFTGDAIAKRFPTYD